MKRPDISPLLFEPLFMERVWGGRLLESLYGKKLPPGKIIGESWEIADRPEAQSVVRQGPWLGKTLHDLWLNHRAEIFGEGMPDSARFPILAKLLDAREKLSLQVHPPASVAASLGGESKNEFWYFAAAEPGAEIFAGLRRAVSPEEFERAVQEGTVTDLVERLPVATGDSFYLPSGRLHAIGGGNLIVEIQQNSDTTYRVFDWDRPDANGEKRTLHVPESMRSIRFDDCAPSLQQPDGEELLRSPDFVIEKWDLTQKRRAIESGAFALIVGLSGTCECEGVQIRPGDFVLVPAAWKKRSWSHARPERACCGSRYSRVRRCNPRRARARLRADRLHAVDLPAPRFRGETVEIAARRAVRRGQVNLGVSDVARSLHVPELDPLRLGHGDKIAPDHELKLFAGKFLLHPGSGAAIGAVEIVRAKIGKLPVHNRIELTGSRRGRFLSVQVGDDNRHPAESEEKKQERNLQPAVHRQAVRAGSIRRRYW